MEVLRMSELSITTDGKLSNIHPGEILNEEFLIPMNISRECLSKETKIPASVISEIILGNKSISADIAIRLSRFFGTSAEFWLNLQMHYDLEEEKALHSPEFERIKRYDYACVM